MPSASRNTLTSILKRAYWSAADARVVLDALGDAGTSVTDFARAHGLDPQRLYAWRRRLDRAPPRARPLSFVELPTTAPPVAPARYEITLPSGTCLRIEGTVVADDLTVLLTLLGAGTAPC